MFKRYLLFGVLTVCLFGLETAGDAQLPQTREQRLKKLKIQRQMKCLRRCEKKGYRKFYRCGPGGSSYCKARAGINFRGCIRKCQAPWFCKGYRAVVRPKCPKMCLNARKKTMPKQRWRRRPTRRQYRRWAKRFLRWQKRTRYACKKVCLNYNQVCNIRASVKFPAITKVPKFENLQN